MLIIYFITGLCFGGLGLAAYLQWRREGEFPLKRELPWLAAFGFMGGVSGWIDMFLVAETSPEIAPLLDILRIAAHLITAVLLVRFGWGMLSKLDPLPAWAIFIPGILIVPIAFVITYAATTFVTPSPIKIPIEIWTRYLLYLPGSLLAGIGFIRQWYLQRARGMHDVATLMLGAGLAFAFEAVVVGLVVPAAPYGPASYYNYDRVIHNAFVGESSGITQPYGLMSGWLDYQAVLNATGLPIEFWRMLSAGVVTLFVVKALDVFEAIRRQQVLALQQDRDRARQAAFEAQIEARQTAEEWTKALISTGRRIAELEHVDDILLFIVDTVRKLLMADFAGVAILDERRANLELRCLSTAAETSLVTEPPQVISNPLIQEVLVSFHSYCSPAGEPAARLQGLRLRGGQEAGSAAIVPLLMENTAMGAMWVARGIRQPFSETDLVWLEGMGDQVEIAIQHGLMTAQLQSLSVVEERGRIAREMHDGLAQVLGYLNLQVQTLGSLLKQGKEAQLQQELAQMRQAVQTANADVRENILSLRTTLSTDTDLASAVEEYLQEFGIQTGIETKLLYEVEGQLQLASMAEVQLVCILQEALTNVRKHARASYVSVSISRDQCMQGEEILMRVQDNGVGYAPSGSKRSFGVQTMRERAQSVSGKLAIHSQPGGGTQVECRLPRLPAERLPRQSTVIP
jgi:signal transduction histidine kinase